MGCMGEFSHLFRHWSSFARVAWHPGLIFPLSETCINHHLKGIQRKLHQQCHPDMGRSAREINYVGKVLCPIIGNLHGLGDILTLSFWNIHWSSLSFLALFSTWHCHRICLSLKFVSIRPPLRFSIVGLHWYLRINNLLQLILKRHLSPFVLVFSLVIVTGDKQPVIDARGNLYYLWWHTIAPIPTDKKPAAIDVFVLVFSLVISPVIHRCNWCPLKSNLLQLMLEVSFCLCVSSGDCNWICDTDAHW